MSDRLITEEIFWEPHQGFDVRGETVISDDTKIRLDAKDFQIKLKLQSDFRYPTDADLHARSRTYNPGAVAKLLIVQVNGTFPTGTSVGLRLFDGTDERYWDGGAWAVAGASDWNTEAEVNANLASFDVETSRQFAVVLNLVTTDDKVTPEVESVFVLWESEREIDWADDLLVDSLVATLQAELRLPVDQALPPLPSASASIDLDDYRGEDDLTVLDVTAVYDYTADPGRRVNLLSSYDSGTRVVTLTAPIPQGNKPYLRTEVDVHVAWDTSRDFSELGKLPQVVVSGVESARSSPWPDWAKQGIVRKDTYEAVELPAPYRVTYDLTATARTLRTRDMTRLHGRVLRLFLRGPSSEVGPFIRSAATDRRYRILLRDEFRKPASRQLGDVEESTFSFELRDAAFNLRASEDTFAVQRFVMTIARIDGAEAVKAEKLGAPTPTTTPEQILVT